jgi:hypothetical protein
MLSSPDFLSSIGKEVVDAEEGTYDGMPFRGRADV